MATALIQNGAAVGAVAALVTGRSVSSGTAADYETIKDISDAIATEVAAACVTASVADADKAAPTMQALAQAVTQAVLTGRDASSITAADYLVIATAIAAIMKESLANLT